MLIIHFCPFGTEVFRTKINIYSRYTESVLFKPFVNIFTIVIKDANMYVCLN